MSTREVSPVERAGDVARPMPAGRSTYGATLRQIHRVRGHHSDIANDVLAIEEPLEIRVLYQRDGERVRQPVAVTMRTPGTDVELALGFLYGEGILSSRADFRVASHFGPMSGQGTRNVVHIELADSVAVNLVDVERRFYTTSSCGVCGKASLESVAALVDHGMCQSNRRSADATVDRSLVGQLPERLRAAQSVFDATGGLHAAALFTTGGELMGLREDVGRHNALDKLVGWMLIHDLLPAASQVLVLSGRASFELIQKAARAGIAVVVAIGAPSSLAVQLAEDQGITLVGFARRDRFNIYSHPTRIP